MTKEKKNSWRVSLGAAAVIRSNDTQYISFNVYYEKRV